MNISYFLGGVTCITISIINIIYGKKLMRIFKYPDNLVDMYYIFGVIVSILGIIIGILIILQAFGVTIIKQG